MKVLHLIAGDLSGGAAKGALNLHEGLISLGVDSKILTNSVKSGSNSKVSTISTGFSKWLTYFRSQFDQKLKRIYGRCPNTFSSGFFGANIKNHPWYMEADVIHMHWINSGFISISDLKHMNKPLIWTLRDMWAFTGGCHYSLDCNRYLDACGTCPQLSSSKSYDISRLIYSNKMSSYPDNMTVVGISNWIKDEAINSGIFPRTTKFLKISNSINTNNFKYIEKEFSRNFLGIDTSKTIILFGATTITGYYKGFDLFIDALKFLDPKDYFLCFFGKGLLPMNIKNEFQFLDFGYIEDAYQLNCIYAAADVFIASSIQEAFGKTIVESMSSGTPVVSFNATGPRDIIKHKVSGYLAEPFVSHDLAVGIDWVVKNSLDGFLPKYVAKDAREYFDSSVIAAEYRKLYYSKV